MRHIDPSSSVIISWFTAAALAGWTGCGFHSPGSGNNGGIDATVNGQDVDGAVDPIDAALGTCYGPPGWQACFTTPPSGDVVLPGTINTDGGAPCLSTQPMGWVAPQPPACFIIGDTITVPSGGGGTTVNGSKPLVLIAKSMIKVSGALDVASHKGNLGTNPSECQGFTQTPNMPGTGVGGSGGAGGSFRAKGGNGGNGDNAVQNGQASPADAMAAPDHLRGGCPGQTGGALTTDDAGAVGFGGGSIYLISGDEIALQKSINASGAGGGGGVQNFAGGSGGGSGGMIVLYAAAITGPSLSAPAPILIANGGSGGGGALQNTKGGDGSDPMVMSALLPVSGGGPNGGKGYSVTNPTDVDGASGATGTGGGGGGGGGGGAGYIRSNKLLTRVTASPMVDIVP